MLRRNNPDVLKAMGVKLMIRSLDLIFSGLGLVILFPIFLLIIFFGYCIQFPSPIFSQPRVGKNGEVFTLYKLRTMKPDTGCIPTHLIDETQVTRFGKLLRKTKVDELPQLWNVFVGDMSLVGPRPCLVSQHELICERKARDVLDVKPGITGLAQIQRVDMSSPKHLAEIEARMIQTMSLRNYLKYLTMTVLGSGAGDSVRPR